MRIVVDVAHVGSQLTLAAGTVKAVQISAHAPADHFCPFASTGAGSPTFRQNAVKRGSSL